MKILVQKEEKVMRGDHLMIRETMKMETTVQAPFLGVVKDLFVSIGDAIQTGDLLHEITKSEGQLLHHGKNVKLDS